MTSLQIVVLCCLIAAVLLTLIPAFRARYANLNQLSEKAVQSPEQKRHMGGSITPLEWDRSRYANVNQLSEEEWLNHELNDVCDGHLSNLYEEMMDRENARKAGCTVEQLCRCGRSARNDSLGNGDLCDDCFIPPIVFDVIERARLLGEEPLTITCTSFAKFVIAVKHLRNLENLELITFTLHTQTKGVYDVFSWQPNHQEVGLSHDGYTHGDVVVEHHFLLEGCPGGDTDYSCYSYEEWCQRLAEIANS